MNINLELPDHRASITACNVRPQQSYFEVHVLCLALAEARSLLFQWLCSAKQLHDLGAVFQLKKSPYNVAGITSQN